ncbi:hypothetical protein AVEN_240470-1 [Araneus ventricosus]|uniref:Uncharacterized protein n=1 Tax=Araneus ventricosus TaxID=182803 RepID=A0A4Y2WFA1_ARAVE|nr:hypothetical protein AVEN_240470-1 [Araneus ventricosus]
MCRLGSAERWVQQVPTILLGIRTAFKEDINASSAELAYGSNLRLPDQFLQDNSVKTEPSKFLDLLRQHFRDPRPVAASSHSSAQNFCLQRARQLFLCVRPSRRCALSTPTAL